MSRFQSSVTAFNGVSPSDEAVYENVAYASNGNRPLPMESSGHSARSLPGEAQQNGLWDLLAYQASSSFDPVRSRAIPDETPIPAIQPSAELQGNVFDLWGSQLPRAPGVPDFLAALLQHQEYSGQQVETFTEPHGSAPGTFQQHATSLFQPDPMSLPSFRPQAGRFDHMAYALNGGHHSFASLSFSDPRQHLPPVVFDANPSTTGFQPPTGSPDNVDSMSGVVDHSASWRNWPNWEGSDPVQDTLANVPDFLEGHGFPDAPNSLSFRPDGPGSPSPVDVPVSPPESVVLPHAHLERLLASDDEQLKSLRYSVLSTLSCEQLLAFFLYKAGPEGLCKADLVSLVLMLGYGYLCKSKAPESFRRSLQQTLSKRNRRCGGRNPIIRKESGKPKDARYIYLGYETTPPPDMDIHRLVVDLAREPNDCARVCVHQVLRTIRNRISLLWDREASFAGEEANLPLHKARENLWESRRLAMRNLQREATPDVFDEEDETLVGSNDMPTQRRGCDEPTRVVSGSVSGQQVYHSRRRVFEPGHVSEAQA